jgi:hypothetical protein
MPFMPTVFLVLTVGPKLKKLRPFGLIVAPQLREKILVVSGKNFIIVSAIESGGVGVAIDLQLGNSNS